MSSSEVQPNKWTKKVRTEGRTLNAAAGRSAALFLKGLDGSELSSSAPLVPENFLRIASTISNWQAGHCLSKLESIEGIED